MGLSFDEAKHLAAGTRLKVEKNDHIYEVIEVLVNGDGSRIHLVLKRDDGYETFAKDHEFDVMSVAVMPEPSRPDVPSSESDQTPVADPAPSEESGEQIEGNQPTADSDSTPADEVSEPSDQPAAEKRKGKK